jgi:hypothetical protein
MAVAEMVAILAVQACKGSAVLQERGQERSVVNVMAMWVRGGRGKPLSLSPPLCCAEGVVTCSGVVVRSSRCGPRMIVGRCL